jgi:hypothetical protein
MLASVPQIISLASAIISGAQTLIQLGKDAGPSLLLLKELVGGKQITVEELAVIRARSDAMNAELEGQTEAGGV